MVTVWASMLEIIEKLLILQDRDRRIRRLNQELAQIGPERESLRVKAAATQTALEAARVSGRQIETERKQRDLEIQAKNEQIERYQDQQLLTRKNEEYKALAHEIQMAKDEIFKIEDAQIVLMEKTEAMQKELARATAAAGAAKKLVEDLTGQLNQREENLKKELAELQAGRAALAAAVDGATRTRYERLMKNRGENLVVGIEHSACGGCHVKLPPQIVANCRAQTEIVGCPNCSRILYFTPDMVLTAAE